MLLTPGMNLAAITVAVDGRLVRYQRRDGDHTESGEVQVDTWETIRTIEDREEYDRAKRARYTTRNLLTSRKHCSGTPFGSLYLITDAAKFEAATQKARAILDTFNASAKLSQVRMSIFPVEISSDNVEAARAVRVEVSRMLDDLERAIRTGDPKQIAAVYDTKRGPVAKIANRRLPPMAGFLADEKAEKAIEAAVAEARQVARRVRKVAKESASKAVELIEAEELEAISSARLIFDTTETVEPEPPEDGPIVTLDVDSPPESPQSPSDGPEGEEAEDTAEAENAQESEPQAEESDDSGVSPVLVATRIAQFGLTSTPARPAAAEVEPEREPAPVVRIDRKPRRKRSRPLDRLDEITSELGIAV